MRELFLHEAIDIGLRIEQHTRRARDGSVYWTGPANFQGEMRMAPLGPPLYAGSTGIALFLAALENVSGEGRFGELCLEGLRPMRRELLSLLDDPARMSKVRHGIGGLAGLGSLVYALVRIGDLLARPELYDFAHDLSSLITEERIADDAHFDLMLGSAGAILALLALDEKRSARNRGGRTPLQLAGSCAQHLLARYRPSADDRRGEQAPAGPARGGFCHGFAGIAHALLHLHGRQGTPELLDAAEAVLRHQDSMFDPERRDWSYLQGPEPRFMNSWCKGAPGIVLALCCALETADTPDLRQKIRTATEIAARTDLSEVDDVCCGNFGRVDALLYVHETTLNARALVAADNLALRIVERARACKTYTFHQKFRGIFDPRFFPGLSGIGLTLLRLSRPASLPSILAMS